MSSPPVRSGILRFSLGVPRLQVGLQSPGLGASGGRRRLRARTSIRLYAGQVGGKAAKVNMASFLASGQLHLQSSTATVISRPVEVKT